LQTHALFMLTGQKWEHVVWTNDKKLFPKSVESLEKAGIRVREISEVEKNLKLIKNIRALIEAKELGMAVDALRYDLIYLLGGISADLGYMFERSVEVDIHRFDFFNQGTGSFLAFENYFFAAKANHPILKRVLDLVDMNLNRPPSYLDPSFGAPTNGTTYYPLMMAYYGAANQSTCDVIYPGPPLSREAVECSLSREALAMQIEYAERRAVIVEQYCGRSELMRFKADMARFNEYVDTHTKFDDTGIYRIGRDDKSRGQSWCKDNNDYSAPALKEQKEEKKE
jgi:hypothetical protein